MVGGKDLQYWQTLRSTFVIDRNSTLMTENTDRLPVLTKDSGPTISYLATLAISVNELDKI